MLFKIGLLDGFTLQANYVSSMLCDLKNMSILKKL